MTLCAFCQAINDRALAIRERDEARAELARERAIADAARALVEHVRQGFHVSSPETTRYSVLLDALAAEVERADGERQ